MAANQLRAMYARIGFTNGADDNIVDVQHINTTTELGYLNDDDVVNLCKTIRHLGGHLPNPAFVAGEPLPATIPYAGIMVSQRAENNLQLASYTVRHHMRISRNANIPGMNPTSVRRLRELKIKEGSRDQGPPTLPKIDPKNWPKTIDAIQDHFSTCLGETKAPLAYVIRDEATVPVEADDPQGNYATLEEEMIRRMPHTDAAGDGLPTYQHDRTKVWQALSDMTRDEKCWTYVKPFQRARDGRSAFLALHTHYLGANHANNMASEAESSLAKAMYHKEKQRYNFKSCISALNEQFQILNGLQRYGYSGIDEATQARSAASMQESRQTNAMPLKLKLWLVENSKTPSKKQLGSAKTLFPRPEPKRTTTILTCQASKAKGAAMVMKEIDGATLTLDYAEGTRAITLARENTKAEVVTLKIVITLLPSTLS
jgi:hypothetical protein